MKVRPFEDFFSPTNYRVPYEKQRRYRERHPDLIRQRRDEKRQRVFQYVENYKATHPCVHCGEARPPVLQFHHHDPATKKFEIGKGLWNRKTITAVDLEIAKCAVLCANCHIIEECRLRKVLDVLDPAVHHEPPAGTETVPPLHELQQP